MTVRLPGGEEVTGAVTSSMVVEDTAAADGGGGRDGDPGSTDTITRVEATLDEEVDESCWARRSMSSWTSRTARASSSSR